MPALKCSVGIQWKSRSGFQPLRRGKMPRPLFEAEPRNLADIVSRDSGHAPPFASRSKFARLISRGRALCALQSALILPPNYWADTIFRSPVFKAIFKALPLFLEWPRSTAPRPQGVRYANSLRVSRGRACSLFLRSYKFASFGEKCEACPKARVVKTWFYHFGAGLIEKVGKVRIGLLFRESENPRHEFWIRRARSPPQTRKNLACSCKLKCSGHVGDSLVAFGVRCGTDPTGGKDNQLGRYPQVENLADVQQSIIFGIAEKRQNQACLWRTPGRAWEKSVRGKVKITRTSKFTAQAQACNSRFGGTFTRPEILCNRGFWGSLAENSFNFRLAVRDGNHLDIAIPGSFESPGWGTPDRGIGTGENWKSGGSSPIQN